MSGFRLDDTGGVHQVAPASIVPPEGSGETSPREAAVFHGFRNRVLDAADDEDPGSGHLWGFAAVRTALRAAFTQLWCLLFGSPEQEGGVHTRGRWDPLADALDESRRRNRFRCLFVLLLITLPSCIAAVLLTWEQLDPAVQRVAPDDAATVQKIFFGGQPSAVYCVKDQKGSGTHHLPLLNKAAEILRPEGIKVAEVHCWTPLPMKKGPRTLASRFGFGDQPPVILFASGKDRPTLLDSRTIGYDASALVRQVRGAVRDAARGTAAKQGAKPKKDKRQSKTRPKKTDL